MARIPWQLIGTGLLLFASSLSAQEQLGLSMKTEEEQIPKVGMPLVEVVQRAEANSPALREALAEIEVFRGKAIQAGLYPNPIASGGSPQWGGSESQFYGQLSQEIVTKGKLRLNRAVAEREVIQAELRFVRVRFDLLTQVRRAFYETLAGQERVRILTELVEVAKQSEESVAKLEKGGEGTRADLLLIEIERQKAEVGLENAQALLEATRRRLVATMGEPNLELGELAGDLDEASQDFTLRARSSGQLDENALMRIARVEADRTRVLLRRAIVEPFPNVTVGAGYMQETTFPNNLGLVSVEMPIPVWNRNQGNIRSARGAVSKATESIERTYNQLVSDLATTVGRYEAAAQQVERFAQAIMPKAHESMDITRKAFRGGQLSFLSLLQAQRSNAEAELGYINALESKWTAATEIAGLLQLEAFP
jgi:cobalt-zinc-cadmium efflux system outer membrane protein